MKNSKNFFLSLAAPCLVLLSLLGFFYRKDTDRIKALPALATGLAVISSNILVRNIRREKLLKVIEQIKNDLN